MSPTIREIEKDWMGTGKNVPPAVRAMWFLSSVIIEGRRWGWRGRAYHDATSDKGTEGKVRTALEIVVAQGRTAETLLAEIDAAAPRGT